MKKHELIKYAYDNYPKGVKFDTPFTDGISTGKFTLWQPDFHHLAPVNGVWRVDEDGKPSGMVFDGDKWAEIIPESILSGKCAIQVNNEREFKLLMEHYESKGWKWASNDYPTKITYSTNNHSEAITYEDRFSYYSDGYKIIPFDVFAKETGIEVPVFVMTSEDNVPLYKGDTMFWTYKYNHIYCRPTQSFLRGNKIEPDTIIFSTKEAAEKWISEMNKPKEILLHQKSEWPAKVTKNKVWFKAPNSFDLGIHYGMNLTGQELEEIYTAYKSLQS